MSFCTSSLLGSVTCFELASMCSWVHLGPCGNVAVQHSCGSAGIYVWTVFFSFILFADWQPFVTLGLEAFGFSGKFQTQCV
jgi:hypothetical protein